MDHNINAAIADKAVPILTVTHFDGNARRHDLPLIASSLKANSQYKPITVRRHSDPNRDNVVLAGNGTLTAARDILGWTHIAVEYVECDDRTARRINLIDNKANDEAGYDEAALAELIAGLNGDYEGSGFDQDDLDDLLDRLAPATDNPGADGPGEPVIAYQIVFDTEAQQNRWYEHLRALRDLYPDAESIAERLITYLDEHVG